MKGYDIKEELYHSIGHRTTICLLVLENGFEITGTHCLDLSDLIYEESRKEKAFQDAYTKYQYLLSAYNREIIYLKSPITRIGHIKGGGILHESREESV